MSESSPDDYTVQIVMSALGGLILVVSEILPFIKSVKSNGLLELLVNTSKSFLKKSQNTGENEPLINEPLINDLENGLDNRTEQRGRFSVRDLRPQLSEQLDSLNIGVNNITYTLNNYINEAQNSRQLKLQSIELYELNYIINYIKVNYPKKMFQTRFLSKTNKQLLISQGYVVDYDSQNDTHTIKW
jgi:hypothetical protein